MGVAVVNALLGYGGRVGEVVMDSVRCNGSEQTLGGCRHFGINHGDFNCDEGNHKEDHHKNAGVVCHFSMHINCMYLKYVICKLPFFFISHKQMKMKSVILFTPHHLSIQHNVVKLYQNHHEHVYTGNVTKCERILVINTSPVDMDLVYLSIH